MKTPILFIIFNRPGPTAQVFETIRAARPARLYIAADGPRSGRAGEEALCLASRAVLNRIDWPCKVQTLFRDSNLGCKVAVSSAITWFFDQEEEGIVIEDDTLPDASFFPYCEELLARYRNDTRIALISGDNFQQGNRRSSHSYYFSRYNHIWGWASWRRAWAKYDLQMRSWPEVQEREMLRTVLPDDALYNYWRGEFDRMYHGKIDTWDYAWTYCCWVNGMVSILPEVNLVTNIGFGADATHTTTSNAHVANLPRTAISFPLLHPQEVLQDYCADRFSDQFLFMIAPSEVRAGEARISEPRQSSETEWECVCRSQALLNEGRNEEVLPIVSPWCNGASFSVPLTYLGAVALWRLERISEGSELLSRLLAAQPEHLGAKELMAVFQAKQDYLASSGEALESETAVIEIDRLIDQSLAELKIDAIGPAFELIEAARSLGQRARDLHYVRAICFLKSQQPDRARDALIEELNNFPDNRAARELLSDLS